MSLRDDVDELVDVLGIGDIALYACRLISQAVDGGVEFLLTPAGDVDEGSLLDEAPGDGQADTCGASGNERDLVGQLWHGYFLPSGVVAQAMGWSSAELRDENGAGAGFFAGRVSVTRASSMAAQVMAAAT